MLSGLFKRAFWGIKEGFLGYLRVLSGVLKGAFWGIKEGFLGIKEGFLGYLRGLSGAFKRALLLVVTIEDSFKIFSKISA